MTSLVTVAVGARDRNLMGFFDGFYTLIAIGGALVGLVVWIASTWIGGHTFTYKKEPVPEGTTLQDLIQRQVEGYTLVEVDGADDATSEAKERLALTYRTPDGGNLVQRLEVCDSSEAAVSMVRALERQYVAEGFHQVATRYKIVSKQNKKVIGEGLMLGGAGEDRTHSTVVVWNNHRMLAIVTAPGNSFETAMFCSSSKY